MAIGQAAASAAALLAVLLVAAAPTSHAQAGAPTAFLGQLGGVNASAPPPAPAECSGSTPAKLIIDSVTPIPAAGETAQVVVRNIGGQTANITGYRLTGSDSGSNNSSDGTNTLYIANDRRCRENGTVPSGQSLVFEPRSETNQCGFPFQLGSGGTVTLSDYNGAPVSAMSWTNASEGTQVKVTPDGSSAVRVPGGSNLIEVLRSLGNYQTFVLALQAAGLDQALIAASDPNYSGPRLPEQQYVIDLPWWFAGAQGAAPPPPPPPAAAQAPPPVGVPASGPYTIFAPTDDAFDAMLLNLGGGQQKLPLNQLLRLPQLNNILLYHIVPGEYTSTYLRNNTPIYTAQGVEVVPFADGCMTEGKLMLHDSCIDKPTADNYTCEEQRAFGKCDFPFMVSSLAAQWQGGFCQRTCRRCDCSASSGIICSTVVSPDIQASNGVIHGISRVLFPPPVFTKEQAISDAVVYNESLARNQSLGIAPAPGMTGLNDLPGAAANITPGGAADAASGATGAVPDVPGAAAGNGSAAAGTLAAPVGSPAPAAGAVDNSTAPSAGRKLKRWSFMRR